MIRTQIYLTEEERQHLADLSRESGEAQSELIRQAIDLFLEKRLPARRKSALKRAAGLWKERKDLPDFGELRAEWDRDGKP